jgi:hypothetical protein
MNGIPVTFDFEGKTYRGTLTEVLGSGATAMWHLMVDKYYWGRLRYTDSWVLDTNKPGMESKAEEFGSIIIS